MAYRFLPGDSAWYASDSPSTSFSVVFEDDGETGYVYAYDRSAESSKGAILDACHLYDVRSVTDREIESEVDIVWSANGQKAVLLINRYPHALIDFAECRAYCRSNWPPPGGSWSGDENQRPPWSDDLLADFQPPGRDD
jgi:hypothetical protein